MCFIDDGSYQITVKNRKRAIAYDGRFAISYAGRFPAGSCANAIVCGGCCAVKLLGEWKEGDRLFGRMKGERFLKYIVLANFKFLYFY